MSILNVLRGFLEKQFDWTHFIDWHRQLRIVLSIEDKLNYLEQPLPHAPVAPAASAGEELLQDMRFFSLVNPEEGQTLEEEVSSVFRTQPLELVVVQGLRASRKLKPGALSLYVGNGQREAVEAIGNFDLSLPSGLVIVLNNCHYAPSITRGVISVSRLYEDGFINRFVNNTIQVSRNNMVYFSAIPRDGIFEIDLSNSYANESSIYTVSNKRAKLDLDSALLWHCRLRHISKKRIEKLQHDILLNSTNLRAFKKCVPYMSGKMARKPY
ncbi:retrotransposon protein, putative, ty1-copia subclass [Tanacetum coccineum]